MPLLVFAGRAPLYFLMPCVIIAQTGSEEETAMSRKIQYANQTVVCYKEDLAEVMLDFYRIGPVFDPVTLKETDPEAQVAAKVVMTRAAAEGLLKSLSKALQPPQDAPAPSVE